MSVEDERKLFVAGLADDVDEHVLRQVFEADGGTVEEISVPRDRATGRGRGFGFVTMQTSQQAQSARQNLDGSMQGGRQISVRPFRGDRNAPGGRQAPGQDRRPGGGPRPGGGAGGGGAGGRQSNDEATLYVGNLPYDASQADIERVFAGAGFADVQRVHLPTDPDGRARGFGFVTLKDADSAKRAADEMNGVDMNGRPLSVSQARARGAKPPRAGGPPHSGAGPRPPRQHSGDAEGPSEPRSVPPHMMDFEPPPVNRGDDERRQRGTPPGKKKEKKRKNRMGQERDRRRGGEGFRSPRGRGMLDDWDAD